MGLIEHGSLGLPKYGSEEPICWYHSPYLIALKTLFNLPEVYSSVIGAVNRCVLRVNLTHK